jgi:hypothetical protein
VLRIGIRGEAMGGNAVTVKAGTRLVAAGGCLRLGLSEHLQVQGITALVRVGEGSSRVKAAANNSEFNHGLTHFGLAQARPRHS